MLGENLLALQPQSLCYKSIWDIRHEILEWYSVMDHSRVCVVGVLEARQPYVALHPPVTGKLMCLKLFRWMNRGAVTIRENRISCWLFKSIIYNKNNKAKISKGILCVYLQNCETIPRLILKGLVHLRCQFQSFYDRLNISCLECVREIILHFVSWTISMLI